MPLPPPAHHHHSYWPGQDRLCVCVAIIRHKQKLNSQTPLSTHINGVVDCVDMSRSLSLHSSNSHPSGTIVSHTPDGQHTIPSLYSVIHSLSLSLLSTLIASFLCLLAVDMATPAASVEINDALFCQSHLKEVVSVV